MKWKKQILDLGAYQPGKSIDEVKKQFQLESIVKLASNENPFMYSNRVKKVIDEAESGNYSLYPDGHATKLRKELADFLHIKEKQLIFSNGADELIHIISSAILESGKNTVMPSPTFPQYRHNAIVEGAEVREVPLIDGAHDLEGMLARIDENTAIVWLCNPNNPTGIYISEQLVSKFLDRVPKDVLVVLDEAYYEYATADDYSSALSLIENYPNLMVVRTFSKIYGLASFRIGYGIAQNEIIKVLEPVRQPFNTNVLAQRVALEALHDQDFVSDCRKGNKEELERYYRFCREHHLHYYPSEGNFILIDFGCDGDEVFSFLLSKGYIVRSGKALGTPTCVRITIGTKEQNDGLMKAMEAFLDSKKLVKGRD